jgi:N-acetylmuramoyl-L-alanine amidase
MQQRRPSRGKSKIGETVDSYSLVRALRMQPWKHWLHTVLLSAGMIACGLPLCANAVTPATLKQVQLVAATPDNTRLELALSKSTTYRYFFLPNPDRLVVDFKNTTNAAALSALPLKNTLVQHVRAGIKEKHDLRLVFDVAKPASILVTSLPPTKQYPERLLLNVHTRSAEPAVASAKTVKKAPADKAAPVSVQAMPSQPVVKLPTQQAARKIMIVIDPGHGGKDPGAKGPSGAREKDVVLGISQQLYKMLRTQPGVSVSMTRYGDYYVGLRQRLQLARRNNADIFIAIHADAYKDPYSSGASVFALSLRGASSEAARWLAAKENYSELGGVNLDGKNDMLRSVLIDLSQTATISSSLWLGEDVLKHVQNIAPLHRGKVEQAPFVVLKSPDIPSILIETGFISNPHEERNLTNPTYQKQIAAAIVSGINQYFSQHPPSKT